MSYVPRPLPDDFDSAMGHKMATGTAEEQESARRYLVAEGASSPDEAAFFDEFTKALMLTKDMIDAAEHGDDEQGEAALAQLQQFSPEVLEQVQTGMLFTAGRKQGWLPETDYDRLAAAAATAPDGELTAQLRNIRRGRSL